MHPLATYLRALHEIRSSGAAVHETSYYGTLEQLLNEVGKTLKPRVRCIINLKNQGAGIPDGGLFTPDQLQRRSRRADEGDSLLDGLIPARGAIEVKGTGEDVERTAGSEQVEKYLKRYGQVLVTNYRDFMLLGQDDGRLATLERYRLAKNETEFWRAAGQEAKAADEQGERFMEYLKRVMLHRARLSEPRDLAWFLASYARDARARIEAVKLPAMNTIRQALEQALGIRFEGERGEHFFRSTLVQTLFYGVFSAWVLWAREHPPSDREARFNWKEAEWTLHVPMIRALFEQFATPSKLGPLALVEVLEWTEAALNRVDRAAFFRSFEQTRAVQYFYEPFLEAFDPELRKQLGVWYTPPEIVQYMVARVDTALREELKIADGLADPRVYVLDPCCGTGAYLVEVLRRIAETLRKKGDDALGAGDLKRAALDRVFGFEILPAPFVVAHLQLGLMLQQAGAPLSDAKAERAGVYLTNALTGWEPGDEPKQHLLFPELEAERDAADRIKQDVPILVILGNPPYNGFAGVAVEEERELSRAYRTTSRAPRPQGQGLNDLYVRFFRMAERKIVDGSGRGVVCFISNYSWLDGLSFTGMRERYLEVFDRIWIDCLNGDKYKTGKLTPEGEPDPSVFSTEFNREGIQVGTAVTLLVRRGKGGGGAAEGGLGFRHFWGEDKRRKLLESASQGGPTGYENVVPMLQLGLPFTPVRAGGEYHTWPSLPELFPTSFPGVKTSRDDVVVDIDRERLVERMMLYFDPKIRHEEARRLLPAAMTATARFDPEAVRETLLKRGFLAENVVRYSYRPFDVRWLYWEPETKLLDEKRSEYRSHVLENNPWIVAQQKPRRDWSPPQLATVLGCIDLMDRSASYFPLYLKPAKGTGGLLEQVDADIPGTLNLSRRAFAVLDQIGTGGPPLFYHILAILHSPAYRQENAGALRQDWPRVPIPSRKEGMVDSAVLGFRLAVELAAEWDWETYAEGPRPTALKLLSRVTRAGGGTLNPDAGELEVTAGWGNPGKGGITMPGKGRVVERGYTAEERTVMGSAVVVLGETTFDVYLNDVAYWRNIPSRVWEYSLGGYQVIKKWLSYRERDLLGRSLTAEEARYVQEMTRRIGGILLMEPQLDANYEAVKRDSYPWMGGSPSSA